MKVRAIHHGIELAQGFGAARSAGVHVSDLYNDWYKAMEPARYGRGDGDLPPLLASAARKELWEYGMCWEEALEDKLRERMLLGLGGGRAGEFQTLEGFYFTPDLMMYLDRLRLGEIKLTHMSTKGVPWKPGSTYTGLPGKFDKYVTQMKIYGHHLEIPDHRLYVFFTGSVAPWATDRGTALRAWDITFTRQEMREEWLLVKKHAQRAGLIA